MNEPCDSSYVIENGSKKTESMEVHKKQRKKTVVEMLLTESDCIKQVSREFLIKTVDESTILEEDRKQYLIAEIPKAKLGHLLMPQAHQVLEDLKTLMFFLGPFAYEQSIGTIMLLVQSHLHVIYPVFLHRDITKTTKTDQGIFSFQFGPPKPGNLLSNIENTPLQNTNSHCANVLDSKTQEYTGAEITKNSLYGYTNKRQRTESLHQLSCSSIHGSAERGICHNNIEKRPLIDNASEMLPQNRSLPAALSNESLSFSLKNQVTSLQVALVSTTKSIMATEAILQKQIRRAFGKKISILEHENEQLRKINQILQKQVKILQTGHRSSCADSPSVDMSMPTSLLKHGGRLKNKAIIENEKVARSCSNKSYFRCRWARCDAEVFYEKSTLLDHLLSIHTKSQLESH